jgi:HK97 family phage prohead protease
MYKDTSIYNMKAAGELKDLDLQQRQVAMYVSKYDVADSDKDVIRKGSFAKSISERGPESMGNRKIAFLRYHDWEKQIGKPIKMEEDDNGLFVVSQLGNSTMGNDALEDYKDGIIREHSIGFKYIADKIRYDEDKDIYEITELALWEYSAVTFGANQYTNVIDVAKGVERKDMAKKLLDDMELVAKALANGKGTDERLYNLEMKQKFLNARMYDLAITNPNDKVQLAEKGIIAPSFDWNKVVNNINL